MESNHLMADTIKFIRIGIIGCGALGIVHAQRLSALPGIQICAVSDPDDAAMRRVADVLPEITPVEFYSDYRDMLANANLTAVCINSPNRWHVEQLLASLDRKLHVLCEKPLSMVPAEVEQVVEATKAAGTTVAIAYQSRYRRDSRILRRALQSGAYGKVTSIDVFSCEDWITPNRGTWRHDPDRCPGGFFADANGHQLDLLFWLTGLRPLELRATIENRGTPVPMVTWGEARLGDGEAPLPDRSDRSDEGMVAGTCPLSEGVPFTFTFVGDARHWGEDIHIQTEKADFVMRDTKLLWSDGTQGLGPFPDPPGEPAPSELGDTPDGAFIAALRGGPPVVSPPHTVWPVLRFTLAALESARRGEPVRCD